jgi:hypothetical protein
MREPGGPFSEGLSLEGEARVDLQGQRHVRGTELRPDHAQDAAEASAAQHGGRASTGRQGRRHRDALSERQVVAHLIAAAPRQQVSVVQVKAHRLAQASQSIDQGHHVVGRASGGLAMPNIPEEA